MALSRIAWLLTVAVCLITAALLVVAHYRGYAAVAVAVAFAASTNLF
jgi:hypothetical protein